MKKFIYISLAAICLSVITGCKNTDLPKPTTDPNKSVKVTQKMLFRGVTKYADILCDCEKIGYISTKQNSIDEAEMFFQLPSAFQRGFDETNVNAAPPKPRNISFAVNGTHARELVLNTIKPNRQFFGSNVTFSLFKENGVMKAPRGGGEDDGGEGSVITITMYVPDLLQITSPSINTPEDLLPYCYYQDFVLGWNADPQNENGLVVVVEWNGRDLYGNEYKEYVRNADIIKNDNGKAVLNNKLFDGIPQGAIVQIQLIRGNIEATAIVIDEDGNEEEFTFVAASQAILPSILVREIE